MAQVQDNGTRPIANASRTIRKMHETSYSISQVEALGIVWAVKHFTIYLYGNRCNVFTDHEAPKSFLTTPH